MSERQNKQATQATETSEAVQWIKGAGDVGSAVAHALRRAGLRPILCEHTASLAPRRLMAFARAVHGGSALLEGLQALRCAGLAEARACLEQPDCLPLLVRPAGDALAPEPFCNPAVVVDARMRKRAVPSFQRNEAPLVIGIGPGFVAGEQVHAVVESSWGEQLGEVLWQGGAKDYTGQPRQVGGYGRERYLYAPVQGVFHTELELLAPVNTGDMVGQVDHIPLRAAVGGILRGLVEPGTPVGYGVKLAEIDPRGDPALCIGIGERPARIAKGVLRAIGEPPAPQE